MKCAYCKMEFDKIYTCEECSINCRLLNRVKKSNDCWEFTGFIQKTGYGLISYQGKMQAAHRVSFKVFKEEIPERLFVCHTCDNRRCINPDHLWIGTRKQNIQDASNKGKLKGSKKGRKISEKALRSLKESRICFGKGETHKRSKLKNQEVENIHIMLEKGCTQKEISQKYNVCQSTISHIKCKRNWIHTNL